MKMTDLEVAPNYETAERLTKMHSWGQVHNTSLQEALQLGWVL